MLGDKHMNTAKLLISAASCVTLASGAFAQSAISIITPGVEYSGSQYTLGFEFSVDDAESITGLGVYDSGQDGLNGRAFVGLWDTSGNLLVSTIVGAGTAGTLDNYFRYNSITPYALVAGQHYIVGAFEPDDLATSWNTGQGGSGAVSPHVTVYGDRYSNFNNAFSFPDTTDSTAGAWLGGNVFLGTRAVPEPASWAMMLGGFGVVGGALRARRKAAVSFG